MSFFYSFSLFVFFSFCVVEGNSFRAFSFSLKKEKKVYQNFLHLRQITHGVSGPLVYHEFPSFDLLLLFKGEKLCFPSWKMERHNLRLFCLSLLDTLHIPTYGEIREICEKQLIWFLKKVNMWHPTRYSHLAVITINTFGTEHRSITFVTCMNLKKEGGGAFIWRFHFMLKKGRKKNLLTIYSYLRAQKNGRESSSCRSKQFLEQE